ncbi:MAG: SusC/RagA family TonB-linked outer membrane protein, partial [Cyclobacteriaceae bacterium]
ANITDWLRVGENVNLTYSEREGEDPDNINQNVNGSFANVWRMPGIIPVLDERGNFAGTQGDQLGNAENPVAFLSRAKDDKMRRFRAFGSFFVEVQPIENLFIKTLVGIDYNQRNESRFTFPDPESSESTTSNSVEEFSDFASTVSWTNTATYEKSFSTDHSFRFLVGTELIKQSRRETQARRNDLFTTDVDFRFLDVGTSSVTNRGFGVQNTLLSYFGKIDYDYQDRYLVSFTIRRDGSSIFPENNRWGTFPAVGLGWRISEEAFMGNLAFINNLKIRAGWGQLGNQNIPDKNAALTFFTSDLLFSSYAIGGSNNSAVVGFDNIKRGNPNVEWETTETLNFGFDASLLDNRIDLSFEWFDRDTKDMLIDIPQPGTAGVSQNAFFNVGEVQNQGIELGINYNSSNNSLLTYSIGGNISTYNNEVTVLDPANPGTFFRGGNARSLDNISRTQVGQPIASFHGFIIDGIFQNDGEVDAHADQTGARPGTFRFRDVNGDDVINDEDRTFIGNPHPDFTYGLNVNVGYKNFELDLFFQGVQGNDIFNFMKWFTDFNNFQGNRSTRILNAWSPENPNGEVPLLSDNRPTAESQESTYYIEDGSYFRAKNIQLSYNLPESILERFGLANARVYLQAKNLFTVTGYDGLEPELSLQRFDDSADPTNVLNRERNRDIGIDRGALPIPQTFLVGVNLGF